MTHKKATDIIEEYIRIHYKDECQFIEALKMAVSLLKERVVIENCHFIKKGDKIWYVDFDTGEIEEGKVFSVYYKDGYIDSFSVDFKETGDFDEFIGASMGKYFFTSEEIAKAALINGGKTIK